MDSSLLLQAQRILIFSSEVSLTQYIGEQKVYVRAARMSSYDVKVVWNMHSLQFQRFLVFPH